MSGNETGAREREEIHLPRPTVVPLVTAVGIAILVVGLIMNWILTAVGGVITLIAVLWWVADVKRDIGRLPE